MKNLIIIGIIGAATIASCSSLQQEQQAQNNRKEFMKLKGKWQIVEINNYNKNFRVKPFDEGIDSKCFMGSVWTLVPNNWSGSYTLENHEGCPFVSQNIKFDVKNGNEFIFKKIFSGEKPKQVVSGYSLTLENQTDDSFTLAQNISYQGENIKVAYVFKKISNK